MAMENLLTELTEIYANIYHQIFASIRTDQKKFELAIFEIIFHFPSSGNCF